VPASMTNGSLFFAESSGADFAQSFLCALIFMMGVAATNTLSLMRGPIEALGFILGFLFLWALLFFEAGSTKKERKIAVYTVMAGLALMPVPVYKLAIAAGFSQLYFLHRPYRHGPYRTHL
jgi:hypothetical protein